MSKKRVNVHVGTMEDMGRRFVKAWKRVEHGEKVREEHLTFHSLEAPVSALAHAPARAVTLTSNGFWSRYASSCLARR